MEMYSRHVPERAAVGVGGGGGRRRRGGRRGGGEFEVVVVVDRVVDLDVAVGGAAGAGRVGGEEAVAAERAGGARADEPGVEAGAVEDVAAPELPHLLAVTDGRQAEHALRIRLRPGLLAAVHLDGEAVAALARQRRLVVLAEDRVVVRGAGAGARYAVAEERGAGGPRVPPGPSAAAEGEGRHAESRLAEHEEEEEARQGEGREEHGRQRAAHLHIAALSLPLAGCWLLSLACRWQLLRGWGDLGG
uniref:Uncharacterized protein n=1 Tax=Arundo donax TaxID=35708 RepID=A0A0A9GJL9_ARUDO